MDLEESIEQWEFNSRADALWSVLSAPNNQDGKQGGKWNHEEFFQTGHENIAALFRRLRELGLSPAPGKAFDFGCGVGRLTQALAPHFEHVVGVDAATRMIDLARRYNGHPKTVDYYLNQSGHLKMFRNETFDFILSLIVLQHVPNTAALAYLKEFVRILTPSGILVFQAPSRQTDLRLNIWARCKNEIKTILPVPVVRYLRRALRPTQPVIPMFPIAKETIESFFSKTNVRIVHVEADNWAGPDWESFTYYCIKTAS